MAKKINVGMVGYKFMGKAHSNAYWQVNRFFDVELEPALKAICGRNEAGVKEAAEMWSWESHETSWEKLVARDDIELVDVSTGNDTHRDIAVKAAENKKHVFCEKPLAMDVSQAREMLQAVTEANVTHAVSFNYRGVPAVAFARQLIDEGKLGQIYHFRGTYLQDWIMDPGFPMVWRLNKDEAGSGAHGDLNAHIIDLARYLVGEFDAVVGMDKTFITERPLSDADMDGGLGAKAAGGKGQVTVDDTTLFLAKFATGALGTFEATRFAGGRRNHNRFEINGSKGSIIFNLERLNELQYYNAEDPEGLQGFRTILTTEAAHPYISAWWPPGHNVGYEHSFTHTVYNLLKAISDNKPASPNFEDGVKCQEVLEAVSKSITDKSWVEIKDI